MKTKLRQILGVADGTQLVKRNVYNLSKLSQSHRQQQLEEDEDEQQQFSYLFEQFQRYYLCNKTHSCNMLDRTR